MSEISFEYIIKQKAEGNALAKRIALFCGYIAFFGITLFLIFGLSPVELFIPLILLSAVLEAILALTTWRFVFVEYEVVIGGGDIIITKIYGKKFCKKLLNIPINSFAEIGEYDDQAFDSVSKLSLQKNYICISSLSAPDVYYAIFDEDKDKCILYFDAPERAVELLKKQNSAAFRASSKRM